MRKSEYESHTTRIVVGIGLVLFLLVSACGGVGYFAYRWIQGIGENLSVDTTFATVVAKPGTNNDNAPPEFLFLYGSSVSGIVTLKVTDTNDVTLWEITGPGTTKPTGIVYGQLPPDADKSWKQTTPPNDARPKDIRGQRVKVELRTRYNIPLGPGQQSTKAELEFP
jgi:hypothetical protein